MPTGKNWFNFLFVNLGFVLYFTTIFSFTSVQNIQTNWPKYRCNPMFMLFAKNVDENFVYCVQNMQKGLMGYILQPLNFITKGLSSVSGNFMNDINAVRNMFNTVRNFIKSITETIYGIFLNLIIEFQKIIIGIRDLIGKIVGILTTFLYLLGGSIQTMNSAWNGPPGQLVQAVGSCFHPDTKIRLQNGSIQVMKNLNLGDILENGSRVTALMKIDNVLKEDLFQLTDLGVDRETIYVTGSHLIYDELSNSYMEVKKSNKGILQDKIKTDWFSCIITSDHKIQIGSCLFWDWEDYVHKLKFFN